MSLKCNLQEEKVNTYFWLGNLWNAVIWKREISRWANVRNTVQRMEGRGGWIPYQMSSSCINSVELSNFVREIEIKHVFSADENCRV
jgi:hypothetical protein